VIRLRGWLVEHDETLAGGQFYSDSINDLALLEQVDYPIATNPDRQLLRIAKQRNWPVLNWFALNLSSHNSSAHDLPDLNMLVPSNEKNPLQLNEESVQHLTLQEITHV
jgi:hypothetical protein